MIIIINSLNYKGTSNILIINYYTFQKLNKIQMPILLLKVFLIEINKTCYFLLTIIFFKKWKNCEIFN